MLVYILQMMACSAILYGYYHFFLKNEKFHAYNRFYLIGAVLVSILLPFVKIPVNWMNPVAESPLEIFVSNAEVVTVSAAADAGNHSLLWYALIMILVLIWLGLFIRIAMSIIKIFRLQKNAPVELLDDIRMIKTSDPDAPFSFFKWLFWNERTPTESEEGRQMLRHELYHIRQKHSIDLLLMEILLAVCWFNPFFYLYRREIKTIQEFLADKHATADGDIASYAELLVLQTMSGTGNRLINPFFHNQLKRRITMLLSSKKSGPQWLRKLLVLPVAAIIITLFGFRYQHQLVEIVPEIKSAVANLYQEEPINPEQAEAVRLTEQRSPAIPADTVPAKKAAKNSTEIKYERLENATVIGIASPDAKNTSAKRQSDYAARYPGDWGQFLKTNLDAQIAAKNGAPVGNYPVEVQFIVNEDGSLSNFKAVTHKGFGMEEEVIRVLKASRNWDPGIANENGRAVAVKSYRSQPVTFQVSKRTAVQDRGTVKASSQPEIYSKFDVPASYPGNWRSFLERNLNGQIAVANHAPAGNHTVILQFIVDVNGELSDIKALTKVGYGLEEEAIRVIEKSGSWKPAIVKNKAVKAYRKQPITFQVTEK